MIEEMQKYTHAFKSGLNYVLFDSDEDDRIIPKIDYSDIESLGFKAGFDYGEYCEITHQTMSISQEHLIAIIDKNFTVSLKQMNEFQKREKQYNEYKSGFISGKDDVLTKFNNRDESYNIIPDLDITNIYSIGYYDGYCYFLRDILRIEGLADIENLPKLDEICKDNFEQSSIAYDFSKLEEKVKNK